MVVIGTCSLLLVGEIGGCEAFQGHSEHGAFGHATADAPAQGDGQVAGQQLGLGGELLGQFLRAGKNLVQGQDLGDDAPALGLLGGERALGQGEVASG
ncbi:hypothetical protein OG574_43645 [Streptomyces sp. NBC_01445]|nr:hypothetical protein [Streptomyces sp. NBC_01445]WSE09662.1 hypothetical protein OG574_43645 [Streptomyces sp. NBC_01445]